MEQTAVQLMSRKQRAAKLLTGDIGLTGLDALTEGEGGFEEALLEAIGRDATLFDPSQLFKAAGAVSEIDAEDAGYWNVEGEETSVDGLLVDEAIPPSPALELGGTVTPINKNVKAKAPVEGRKQRAPSQYHLTATHIQTVRLIGDEATWKGLRTELLMMLDGDAHAQICAWLTEHRVVFPGCEVEVAAKLAAFTGVEMVPTPQETRETTTSRSEATDSVSPSANLSTKKRSLNSWRCLHVMRDERHVFFEALLAGCTSYQQTDPRPHRHSPRWKHPTPSRHVRLDDPTALQEASTPPSAANAKGWERTSRSGCVNPV